MMPGIHVACNHWDDLELVASCVFPASTPEPTLGTGTKKTAYDVVIYPGGGTELKWIKLHGSVTIFRRKIGRFGKSDYLKTNNYVSVETPALLPISLCLLTFWSTSL